MPRPRSLTQDKLASAALVVIDRDGAGGLTMRAVAGELGVSPMALYRYLDDRAELERLVVEHILSAMDTTPPDPNLPWRQRIELMLRRMRDTVSAHPAAVVLTLTHRHRSPSVLRWTETVLGILASAGLPAQQRVITLRGLLAYVIGAIQLAHLGSLTGEGTAMMANLDRDEFPRLTETATEAAGVTADKEFDGGLSLILDGIAGAI